MKKVLIINGGQTFGASGGKLNAAITQWTATYFESTGNEVKVTDINEAYVAADEVEKFIWADLIIYQTPVWWFQVPFKLKEYVDTVLETGRDVLYDNDGRSRKNANPKLGYGTGGKLHGRKYIVNTTWNAPLEAFTTEGEIFYGTTPDDILIGMHHTHSFLGFEKLKGFDFHDVIKDMNDDRFKAYEQEYLTHLASLDY